MGVAYTDPACGAALAELTSLVDAIERAIPTAPDADYGDATAAISLTRDGQDTLDSLGCYQGAVGSARPSESLETTCGDVLVIVKIGELNLETALDSVG